MIISFSPQRADEPLTLATAGDALTINGETFDFSTLPNGATIPEGATQSPWIVGPVDRIDDEINVTIRLPVGPNAPQETRFPQPIRVTTDGPINLPGTKA